MSAWFTFWQVAGVIQYSGFTAGSLWPLGGFSIGTALYIQGFNVAVF